MQRVEYAGLKKKVRRGIRNERFRSNNYSHVVFPRCSFHHHATLHRRRLAAGFADDQAGAQRGIRVETSGTGAQVDSKGRRPALPLAYERYRVRTDLRLHQVVLRPGALHLRRLETPGGCGFALVFPERLVATLIPGPTGAGLQKHQ